MGHWIGRAVVELVEESCLAGARSDTRRLLRGCLPRLQAVVDAKCNLDGGGYGLPRTPCCYLACATPRAAVMVALSDWPTQGNPMPALDSGTAWRWAIEYIEAGKVDGALMALCARARWEGMTRIWEAMQGYRHDDAEAQPLIVMLVAAKGDESLGAIGTVAIPAAALVSAPIGDLHNVRLGREVGHG